MLLVEGFLLASTGVILMFTFEFGLSSSDVQRLRNRDGGKELHNHGLRATILNHLILGPITYYLTIHYCCVKQLLPLWQQACSVVGFLLIESALYHGAHYLLHTRHLSIGCIDSTTSLTQWYFPALLVPCQVQSLYLRTCPPISSCSMGSFL